MTESDLPPAELDIMGCLWRLGPATAAEIREAIGKQRPMAHATVCTLLKRLQDKGCVSRKKSGEGKSFRYSAEMKPSRTGRHLLGRILDSVFAGNRLALVAEFLEDNDLSREDLDQLEELVAKLKAERKSGRKRNRKGKRGKR